MGLALQDRKKQKTQGGFKPNLIQENMAQIVKQWQHVAMNFLNANNANHFCAHESRNLSSPTL